MNVFANITAMRGSHRPQTEKINLLMKLSYTAYKELFLYILICISRLNVNEMIVLKVLKFLNYFF